MKSSRKKKAGSVKAWGGFRAGRLNWFADHDENGVSVMRPDLYATKMEAKRFHFDVRCVRIVEVRNA